MAFRWLGSFVIFQGIWTGIAKKPHIFVIFQGGRGGGPDPLYPSTQDSRKTSSMIYHASTDLNSPCGYTVIVFTLIA